MLTRRKFLRRSVLTAAGLWVPAVPGASPIMTRRVVLSKTESPPDMLWQTTKVGLFNPTITKAGLPVEWDYGDGSARELTNEPSHTYAATGTKNVGIRLRDAASKVTQLNISSKSLVNLIPPLNEYISVTYFNCQGNQLTGRIPSFTANVELITFYSYSNQLTNYTASTISLTCTDFRVHQNRLPQSDIDQIAADFATNIAGRPATGTLNVGGAGNAAASAAGIENFNLVAAHGWTVTRN